MKTAKGLVAWCMFCLDNGYGYIYGKYFSEKTTLAGILAKAIQYPKQYSLSYIGRSKKWIGIVAGDCIGMIKAYIWQGDDGVVRYPPAGAIRVAQDKSADGMYNLATVKGKIETIPDIPGLAVRYQNHVGVYIGNGEVIEARGVDYGVVKTKLNGRGWTDWYQIPFINYEEDDIMLKKGDKGVPVYDLQTIYKALGHDIGRFADMYDKKTPNGCDGSFGDTMVRVTKEAQAQYKLPITGMVDGALYGKLAITLMNTSPALKKQLELAQAEVTKFKKEADSLKVKVAQLEIQLKDVPKLKADLAAALSKQQRVMEELGVSEADRNVLANTLENVKQQLNIAEQMKTEAEGRAKSYADELENLQKAFGTIRTFIGG